MRYTTTDGPDEPRNAIQEASLGDKMGIADTVSVLLNSVPPLEKVLEALKFKGSFQFQV